MNTLKSIYDWTRFILFLVIVIVLLLSSISQCIVFYNWVSYSYEQIEPILLTEEESNSFCSNQNCHYTHKVDFDGRYIIMDWHGFHYKDKLWVFTYEEEGRKFIVHKEEYLYEYLYFDLFSIIYLFLYLNSIRNEKEPNSRWKKWISRKKKNQHTEIDKSPLPSFWGIFILGYIEILMGIYISFVSWRFLPHIQWLQFVVQFCSIVVLGTIFYFLFGKRMGIIASSFLTLLISLFSAKDINYIYNISHEDKNKSAEIEQIYTLNEGSVSLNNLGVYSNLSYSTSRRTSRKSYSYYFVAPYLQKEFPEDKTQWVWLKNEWVEDPLRLERFLNKWNKTRLAVQIYDDLPLYAVTVVANYHQIDLTQGIALLKPILSIKEEIISRGTPLAVVLLVFLSIWTLFGALRIYAGKNP